MDPLDEAEFCVELGDESLGGEVSGAGAER
jgi:hypothetical protein